MESLCVCVRVCGKDMGGLIWVFRVVQNSISHVIEVFANEYNTT